MSREEGAAGNALTSVAIQAGVLGVGAAVFLPLSRYGHSGIAAGVFLALALAAAAVWLQVFRRLDGMAAARRDELIETLARAA
jgi:hypothetical protein